MSGPWCLLGCSLVLALWPQTQEAARRHCSLDGGQVVSVCTWEVGGLELRVGSYDAETLLVLAWREPVQYVEAWAVTWGRGWLELRSPRGTPYRTPQRWTRPPGWEE